MDELDFFRKNAILANLCKEWNGKWAACHNDKEKLMRLVLMRQSAPYFATFCYNGAGLSKEYCLEEFGDFVKGRIFNDVDGVEGFTSSMYIDASDGLKIAADTIQMLWCNDTEVVVPQTKCPTFYVSNKSSVNFTLNGFNSITIYLFDESSVTIYDADEESNVLVYRFSDKSEVNVGKYCLAKVKVFDKQLKL